MKCAECEKSGQSSRVYSGGTTSTCMAFSDYWDEEGQHHVHNPNSVGTAYSCSNGHTWWDGQRTKCPSCNFGEPTSVTKL